MINKFLNDDVVVEQITKFGQDNPTLTSIVPKVEDVEDVGKDEPKEMITREQRAILLKQGYGVVGSHRY